MLVAMETGFVVPSHNEPAQQASHSAGFDYATMAACTASPFAAKTAPQTGRAPQNYAR